MQIYCEHCGEEIPNQKKLNNKRRREIIKFPKSYKMRTCLSCGKKIFIKH